MLTCTVTDDSVTLERVTNGQTVFHSCGSTSDDIEASAEDITRYAGRTVRTVDAFDALLYSLPILWTN